MSWENSVKSACLLMLSASLICGAGEGLRVPIHRRELANGMKVFLLERHHAPVFSACLAFQAGSVNDPLGASGVAHVCEHMLFKGTRSFGLKRGMDYSAEDLLLRRLDALWDELFAERNALEASSKAAFLATGKAGPTTSEKLIHLEKTFAEQQAKHREMVEPNELGSLFESAGGVSLNGGTGSDFTYYSVCLPRNRFELYCRIEADRMAHPVFREFYPEREVIKEERRMSYEDGMGESGPEALVFEPFLAAAFPYHPYGRMTIGAMSDLFSMRRLDVQDFFAKNYAPNRCALVLVGDLTMAEVIPFVEAYFGKIAPQAGDGRIHTVSPPQMGERRITVEKDVTPLLRVGWHVPAVGHADVPALQVLSAILSGGRTSRLYRKAVEERQMTDEFATQYGDPGSRYPTLFTAQATPKGGHGTEELEALLYSELERLKRTPPSQEEVARVVRNAEMNLLRLMENPASLADEIGMNWAITGDEMAVFNAVDRMREVRPADISRVVNTYFKKFHRVVAVIVRPNAVRGERLGALRGVKTTKSKKNSKARLFGHKVKGSAC